MLSSVRGDCERSQTYGGTAMLLQERSENQSMFSADLRDFSGETSTVYYTKLKCPAVCKLPFRDGLLLFSQPSDLRLTISVRQEKKPEKSKQHGQC